jgi:hypothetical protein
MQYENRNQVDYGPLVVRRVNGFVVDSQGASIPAANVGVFTEPDHELLFQTTTDSRGFFKIEGLNRGEYRLVSQYNEPCTANARWLVGHKVASSNRAGFTYAWWRAESTLAARLLIGRPLTRITALAQEHQAALMRAWHDFFGTGT